MRRGQDPFVEYSESIAQVGVKMPLEIEWNLERDREVLPGNDDDDWYGRNGTKVAICQLPRGRVPPFDNPPGIARCNLTPP